LICYKSGERFFQQIFLCLFLKKTTALKTFFKWVLRLALGFLALLIISFIILKITFTEDIPSGVSGAPADELAIKMLEAINHEEFKNAQLISWTFRGTNRYQWKPQEGTVQVTWNNMRVELDTQDSNQTQAFEGKASLDGKDKADAIAYAQSNFHNDSFWVVAPFKVMDPGTEREIIKEDAQEKLLVRYTKGGTTPGDVYVWKLDSNYRPQNFQMWVSIIPLDGIEAKWEDWQMTAAGFPLSKHISILGIEIPVTDVSVE
jgi:hypothetical protein